MDGIQKVRSSIPLCSTPRGFSFTRNLFFWCFGGGAGVFVKALLDARGPLPPGGTRDGAVIFYQIDLQGRIHTGKIIQYNPVTGHRIKDTGVPVDWLHARLKK